MARGTGTQPGRDLETKNYVDRPSHIRCWGKGRGRGGEKSAFQNVSVRVAFRIIWSKTLQATDGKPEAQSQEESCPSQSLQYANGPTGFAALSEFQKFYPRLLSAVIPTNPSFNPPIHHLSIHLLLPSPPRPPLRPSLLLFLPLPSHLSSLSSLPHQAPG